jgi:Uma2 family endonuclease
MLDEATRETANDDAWNLDMPSLNHSYVCFQLLRQLTRNERFYSLPEITLDIDNGLTPDIAVFPAESIHPDFFNDVTRLSHPPLLAIEVISPSQNIQAMLDKARTLVRAGVKAVWTVEPFTRSVFVTTPGGDALFHGELVETEGIRVDFAKVFSA